MSQLLYTYHVHHHTCFSKHLPSLKFGENWDNSVSKGISTHITSPPTHPHTPLTYPGAFRVEIVVTIFRLRVEVHRRNVGLTIPCGCHGNTVLVQQCVKWVGGWSQKLLYLCWSSGQIDMTSGLKWLLFMSCGVCGNWFLYKPSEDFFQPS